MKKAGIVVDAWKADTFRQRFVEAQLRFTEGRGPTNDTWTFIVPYETQFEFQNLSIVVHKAYEECKRKRNH